MAPKARKDAPIRVTEAQAQQERDTLPAGLLDLVELEHHAAFVRVATVIHMPGLLQTRDHARALFDSTVPPLPPHAVEHRISHRIKRQAALRMGLGGPTVARAQLHHLIEMSERENVTVLVVPFGSGPLPGSGQPIDYFGGPVPRLDTVQLDTDHGIELLDAEAPS